jgi:hypothetical protein
VNVTIEADGHGVSSHCAVRSGDGYAAHALLRSIAELGQCLANKPWEAFAELSAVASGVEAELPDKILLRQLSEGRRPDQR